MLANIKSSYFIQLIFSYIEERQKLILMKYNKYLQHNMNINIINYKCIYGAYIEYESKEKGKEYRGFDALLIYEGEYLHGRKNGKGTEYYGKK